MSATAENLPEFDDSLEEPSPIGAGPVARHLAATWKRTLGVVVLGAAVGLGGSFLVTPKFTAVSVFLPPAQQQGGATAAAALASLGSLSSLVGVGGNTRSSPDQFVALMQSVTVSDHIIKKFDLRKVWDLDYEVDARKRLAKRVEISAGKKDGLITVQVTDTSRDRAAAMANQYVEELRLLTNGIAVTEAQQRRMFFEHLLEQTRDKLAAAQTSLEGSGFDAGAVNAEPRAAADGYAQVMAQKMAAEVKLSTLRSTLSETAPEVVRQRETVNALAAQLVKLEGANHGRARAGEYISRYREFKYQETLFDLFSKQYESARVDESREGIVQVIDSATPPERKSSPSRTLFTLGGAMLALVGLVILAMVGLKRQASAAD